MRIPTGAGPSSNAFIHLHRDAMIGRHLDTEPRVICTRCASLREPISRYNVSRRERSIMQTESCLRHAVRTAIGATLMVACTSAHSSGFALLEQSASRLGTAFAGTAARSEEHTSELQ